MGPTTRFGRERVVVPAAGRSGVVGSSVVEPEVTGRAEVLRSGPPHGPGRAVTS